MKSISLIDHMRIIIRSDNSQGLHLISCIRSSKLQQHISDFIFFVSFICSLSSHIDYHYRPLCNPLLISLTWYLNVVDITLKLLENKLTTHPEVMIVETKNINLLRGIFLPPPFSLSNKHYLGNVLELREKHYERYFDIETCQI